MEKLAKIFASFGRLYSWLVWSPLEPGEEKQQLNARRVLTLVAAMVLIFVIYALFVPAPAKYVGEFRETLPENAQSRSGDEHDGAIAQATLATQKAFSNSAGGSSLSGPGGAHGHGSSGQDRNTSMVLSRPGANSSNELSAGMKFTVRLLDQLTISDQAVPVIAEVTHGVFNDSGGGIKEGSRLFGMAQFQNGGESAQIQFQSISDSSGIVRNLQGVALEEDGQAGVAGDVHSKSLRNTTGQFVSRFIGAYAEGSQDRDFMGNSKGGAENGLRNAVAETAKDRTTAYAEDLKKEHQWIEIPAGKEVTVILTQTFTFNEPGVSQ